MEKKFTKGEWRITERNNSVVCKAGLLIGDNYFDNTTPQIDIWSLNGVTEEEAFANAKLIAAVPDMLEALEEFIDAIIQSPIDFIPTEKLNKAYDLAWKSREKALS